MSTVLTQIENINKQIEDLKSQMRTLYHSLLSEEATRILGVPLTCKEISETTINFGRKVREVEFINENGTIYAKCVELCYNDNSADMQECFVYGLNKNDANNFMIEMICTVDWTFFQ